MSRRSGFGGTRKRGAGQQALKEVRKLKRLVTMEKKNVVQLVTSPIPLVTAAVALHVSQVVEGPDVNERDGRIIRAQRITVKGQLRGGGGTTAVVRLFLFKDMQNAGSVPAVTDMFVDSTAFSTGDSMSFDPDIRARFKILADKSITIGGATENDNHSKAYTISKKLNSNIFYPGTTSTPGRGSLWFMQGHNLAASGVTHGGNIVLEYIDP